MVQLITKKFLSLRSHFVLASYSTSNRCATYGGQGKWVLRISEFPRVLCRFFLPRVQHIAIDDNITNRSVRSPRQTHTYPSTSLARLGSAVSPNQLLDQNKTTKTKGIRRERERHSFAYGKMGFTMVDGPAELGWGWVRM